MAYDYSDKYLWDLIPKGEAMGIPEMPDAPAGGQKRAPVSIREKLLASNDPNIDYDRIINSPVGETYITHQRLHILYEDEMDPEVLKYWENCEKGLRKELRRTEVHYERYAVYIPLSAYKPENAGRKYPLLFVLPGGYQKRRSSIFTIEGNGFVHLAAREEIITVLPQNSDIDNVIDILHEVEAEYPTDPSRVYCTGYSQGGRHTNGVTVAYRKYFAAAVCGGNHAFPLPDCRFITEQEIEDCHDIDLPVMMIAGQWEAGRMYPFYHTDINKGFAPPVNDKKLSVPQNAVMKVGALNVRLWTSRCPQVTFEQCAAAEFSDDPVERTIGAPFDRTEVREILTFKHYIGDFKNVDGNYHLRFVCYENMPHMAMPTIPDLAWEFMKGYARNRETNELINL